MPYLPTGKQSFLKNVHPRKKINNYTTFMIEKLQKKISSHPWCVDN